MTSTRKRAQRARAHEPSGISDRFTVPGGDGQHLGEAVTIRLAQNGVAVIRPASFDRLSPDALAAAEELQVIVGMRRQLAQQLDQAVLDARSDGLSWGQIGFCVGTSGEAARQRWGQS